MKSNEDLTGVLNTSAPTSQRTSMTNSKEPITNSVVWELKADIADYKHLLGTFNTEQDALDALKRFNPEEHDFNYNYFIDTVTAYVEPKIVYTVKERVLTHITDSYDSYLPTLKRKVDDLKYDISTLKRILDKDGKTISLSDSSRANNQKRLNTKLKQLDKLTIKLNNIKTLSNTKGNDFYTEL